MQSIPWSIKPQLQVIRISCPCVGLVYVEILGWTSTVSWHLECLGLAPRPLEILPLASEGFGILWEQPTHHSKELNFSGGFGY